MSGRWGGFIRGNRRDLGHAQPADGESEAEAHRRVERYGDCEGGGVGRRVAGGVRGWVTVWV